VRRSVLMTKLVTTSGRVGLTRMWTLLALAAPLSVSPPHSVAGCDWARPDQLLALLQGDVGHLSGRGVDLVERSFEERKHLHGIDIARSARLDSGCRVREVDTLAGIARLRRRSRAGQRLELPRQGQRLWQLDYLHGLGRVCLQDRRLFAIVADQRRLERRAAGQRR